MRPQDPAAPNATAGPALTAGPAPPGVPRVLLAGVSTRAAAESAARAGYAVIALDAFADADQHPAVHALSLRRDFGVDRFTPRAAARAARRLDCDAVAYLSSFENHPRAVHALAAGRTLWGNGPETLSRVRDPILLVRTLRRRGFAVPAARATAPRAATATPDEWMLKPRASGGGHGVRPWAGAPLGRRSYLQERVRGTPASLVFVADRARVVPFALSRQLSGDPAFGASGFRYCGSVLAGAGDAQLPGDDALATAALALAAAATEEFGLVGVNGIDVVARDGVAYLLEVNPRWSASMELAERAYGLSVFGAHARACAEGALPAFDLAEARRGARTVGKAIVFARHDVIVGDTSSWLADPDVRDVPHRGEQIARGQPVCTVFAEGRDGAECYASLVARAGRVYDTLRDREREVA